MWADYHTHTTLCNHATGCPEDYVLHAVECGLSEIGISDHAPFPSGFDPLWRMSPNEWQSYLNLVKKLQSLGKKKGIAVRLGMELDWVPQKMQEAEQIIKTIDFDYVIGSVHCIDGFTFDDPEMVEQWNSHGGVDEIWTRYIEQLFAFAAWGHFDILGHLDLPKKFGYYPSETLFKKISLKMIDFFQLIRQKNIVIELNTSGWRKAIKEQYPSEQWLKLAAQAGVGVTLGSDAHSEKEVGAQFSQAVDLLKICGFKELTLFKNRQSRKVSL